jgi:hypothetical protein
VISPSCGPTTQTLTNELASLLYKALQPPQRESTQRVRPESASPECAARVADYRAALVSTPRNTFFNAVGCDRKRIARSNCQARRRQTYFETSDDERVGLSGNRRSGIANRPAPELDAEANHILRGQASIWVCYGSISSQSFLGLPTAGFYATVSWPHILSADLQRLMI